MLQKRTQAEDVQFDAALPADVSAPAGADLGRARSPGDPENVVVSGWQTYNNKGRQVEQYEPFFATGWDFEAPGDEQRGQRAPCSTIRSGCWLMLPVFVNSPPYAR